MQLSGKLTDDIEVVAINDITDAATLAHLLKYDSVHGKLSTDVAADAAGFRVGDISVRVVSEHGLVLQLRRVERAFPLLVGEAGGSGEDVHGVESMGWRIAGGK